MSNSINADETYNDGERMMPVPTYGDAELVRHFSSHKFFRNIIREDIKANKLDELTVLDLGFGTGYASYLYSQIKEVANIHAIDVTDDGLGWALENFNNDKIKYELVDAVKCLSRKRTYDYIVTRHVLEHIEDGLSIIKENKYTKRLLVNVPYDEKEGNPFHLLHGIVESSFPEYSNVEFFYEDLQGVTYDKKPKGVYINSIIFVASRNGMKPVKDYFKFPLKQADMSSIIDDLTQSNLSYARSAIRIMLERYNSVADELKTVKREHEKALAAAAERDRLYDDITALQQEIEAIKGSKKWKYAQKAGEAKNRILGK